MIATLTCSKSEDGIPDWHPRFLAMVPTIRRHSELCFQKLRPDLKEEMVDEVIANCLMAYARLVKRGKEDLAFPSALARFGVARVREGRQVGCPLNVLDVSGRYCQQRKGIQVERLDHFDLGDDEWKEVLVEDRRATPADVAASRIDFAAWLELLPVPHRKIALTLAGGESTKQAAQNFGVSPGRISQIRLRLKESWDAFQGQIQPQQAAIAAA